LGENFSSPLEILGAKFLIKLRAQNSITLYRKASYNQFSRNKRSKEHVPERHTIPKKIHLHIPRYPKLPAPTPKNFSLDLDKKDSKIKDGVLLQVYKLEPTVMVRPQIFFLNKISGFRWNQPSCIELQ
jgi:hypothetical protein